MSVSKEPGSHELFRNWWLLLGGVRKRQGMEGFVIFALCSQEVYKGSSQRVVGKGEYRRLMFMNVQLLSKLLGKQRAAAESFQLFDCILAQNY